MKGRKGNLFLKRNLEPIIANVQSIVDEIVVLKSDDASVEDRKKATKLEEELVETFGPIVAQLVRADIVDVELDACYVPEPVRVGKRRAAAVRGTINETDAFENQIMLSGTLNGHTSL